MMILKRSLVFATASLALCASAAPSKGRYVHVRLARIPAVLSIAELEVYSGGRNVAKGKRATQSSLGSGGVPERAVDGNTNHDWGGRSITHTNEGEKKKPQWWEVDLGTSVSVDKIVLYNRKDFSHRSPRRAWPVVHRRGSACADHGLREGQVLGTRREDDGRGERLEAAASASAATAH